MSEEPTSAPSRSEPTDVDVRRLMAEIAEEVRRKREAGLYPPEILSDLGAVDGEPGATRDIAGRLQPALSDLQRSAKFTALVTSASRRPVVAPLIIQARRAIRASITWYMNGILEQLSRFADNTVRTTGMIAEQVASLDQRLTALEAEAERLGERVRQDDEQPVRERLARLERAVRDLRQSLGTAAGPGDGG